MIPDYVIYPFAGLFIVVGCFATVLGIRMCKEARVTWTWPSTEGIVRGTEVLETCGGGLKGRAEFQPVITYEYSVGGVSHTGKRIKLVDISSSSRYAHRIVARYPVGAGVTVYYDPASPQDAVLRRGNDGNTVGVPAIGIFFVLAGVAICLGYYLFQNSGN
jgi:hypothetical protein